MNKHIEKAVRFRSEIPMVSNCAQTILKCYADELGLTKVQAAGIACNFGGGMKCGKMCGAITGALMVLGAKGITEPGTVRKFIHDMAQKHNGCVDCESLLKLSFEKGVNKKEHCDNMILEAIELIDKTVDLG